MTYDFVTESVLAELRDQADDVDREARALTAALTRLDEALAAQRFTASSPNAAVAATVTGTGRLVDLRIAGVDRRRPRTEQLSADLTAAVHAARAAAAAEANRRLKAVLPGFVND